MDEKKNTTIYAIAAGSAQSALAVVRVSGNASHKKIRRCIKEKRRFSESQERVIHTYKFIDPENENVLDHVTAVKYISPRSFTGENMVELFCHGGEANLGKITNALRKCGCRIAQPGEFCKRAVINKKMSLVKAEAIDGIIRSNSDIGHDNALYNYMEKSKGIIEEISEGIKKICASIEAMIEFSEEDDIAQSSLDEQIRDEMKNVLKMLNEQIERRINVEEVDKGVTIALVGKKNAGKSTIFNEIVGKKRSIVHHTEGTTRDYITEKIHINEIPVTVIDTAGLGTKGEDIEKEGIKRSWELIKKSNIRIWVTEVWDEGYDEGYDEEEKTILMKNSHKKKDAGIINKKDKGDGGVQKSWMEHAQLPYISISMKNGEDRRKVIAFISDICAKAKKGYYPSIIQNQRQYDIIEKTKQCMQNANDTIDMGEEIAAIYCREALKVIEGFGGESLEETILDRVFSNFCIGK